MSSFLVKRGTAAQLALTTPLLAEPVFTTDTLEFKMGDGVTLGGITPSNLNQSSPLSTPGQISAVTPYVVDTWAELKSLPVSTLQSNAVFKVLGKTSPNDGRGGTYTYDPSSSISTIPGLVLAPNAGAGRFLREYGNVIDVFRDLGADNTATFSSQTELQAAIDFAANPTYGWAKESGIAGQLSLAVELLGSFLTTSPLVLKGAVDFRGAKTGGRANDNNQHASILSKHGGHCVTYDLVTDTPYYRLPSIRNINFVGYVETYIQGKKPITAVVSRTVFKVADADAPVGLDNISIYAANNVCVFFDNQGTCLGTGRVTSLSSSGGETTVTLEAGTDAYSSVNSSAGGLLTTACKVVFTPKVTEESLGDVADFYDPASIGCTAIFIKNTHPTALATTPLIENVSIRQFLVGIRVGPRMFGGTPGYSNISIMFCKVAGFCFPRTIHTTDFFFNNQTYVHGGFRIDYEATGRTNTLDQPALAYGTYGMLGVPDVSKFNNLLLEETSFACIYLSRLILMEINHLLCDGIAGTGMLLGPGYASYVSPDSSSSHSNSIHIGSFFARKRLDGTGWDTIHTSTTPVAVRFEATTISSGLPCQVYIGSAAIARTQDFSSPTPLFPYAFDLGARSGNNNRVRIGMLQERNGFTIMHKSGTKEVEFDDRSAVSSSEVYTGWYWDHATSKRIYCHAQANILELSSTGAIFGNSSLVGIPLKTINSSGDCLVLQKTGGSPQSVAARIFTNSLTWVDLDLNLYFTSLFANSSAIQLWLGTNTGNSGAARSSNLYSENRIGGTDLAPSVFNLIAPGGTGAATSGGDFVFYTADPGVSGSTPQSITQKLRLMRSGQLRFVSLSSPFSLGEGDLWFHTTKGFRQYFGASEKGLGINRSGTATLTAGTVTVSAGGFVTATCIIHLTSQADGGTPGSVRVTAKSVGTSFTITSSSNTDTSTIAWSIVEP
jgi:hypothetical protein